MSDSNDEIPLPPGPANLCFNKNDFMRENFNVYQFVNDCRRRVPLETVRDDLNVYLSILRNAMIELINKDYADFVNLSTNLVGLEKVINNLVVPIGQLKEEILTIKSSMNEVVDSTKKKLERRRYISEKKVCLQHLMNISLCVSKIEELLNIHNNDGDVPINKVIDGGLMERIAVEFNQLHFHVTKNKGHVFVDEIKPRIVYITRILQTNLEQMFLIGVKENNFEQLQQCLRIYATIDRMKEVESLFRKHIVKPFMDDVINEEKLRDDGLQEMYDQILKFVPNHCNQLKVATTGTDVNSEIIHGYDFLVNAVWPEFVSAVEVRLTSIFAPANTKAFHEKYTLTMRFMDQFEELCGTQISVKRLREHPSYISFMNKWNLPIYFQIRFQDIAGLLESALISPWNSVKDETTDFSLHISHTLWQCLHTCWSPEVYLSPLCHRFWKLSLQLVSRYCEWVKTVTETRLCGRDKESSPSMASSTESMQQIINSNFTFDTSKQTVSISAVVLLFVDIQILIPKLSSYCDLVVAPRLLELGFKDVTILSDSMEEFQQFLSSQIPHLTRYVTECLAAQCGNHLKLVNDIPRLYRRTNREVPTKSSSYVNNTFQPLQAFLENQKSILKPEVKDDWGLSILGKIAQQYYEATSNVLTSVKKMEESLSRLKKAREKGNTITAGLLSGMSDDDKIRSQLALDVQHFGELIDSLRFDKSKVNFYQELTELIESARVSPSRA